MQAFKKRVRSSLEALTGWDIVRFGGRSIALIDRRRRMDAWFFYRAQVRSAIEDLGIDLVLDVGANEGQFARELRTFYAGDIHSFEPVSFVFEKLSAASAGDRRWHVHQLALGSRETTLRINIPEATVFSSFLKTSAHGAEMFGEAAMGRKEETVSVRRLDHVLGEIVPRFEGRRIFLKMDTQGYDAEVFGGLGTALNHVHLLQSELSVIPIYDGMPHWTESIAAYERGGFGVAGMFPVNLVSGRVVEYDCLLRRIPS